MNNFIISVHLIGGDADSGNSEEEDDEEEEVECYTDDGD